MHRPRPLRLLRAAPPPWVLGWGQDHQLDGSSTSFSGRVGTFVESDLAVDASNFTADVKVVGDEGGNQDVTGTVAPGAVAGEWYINCSCTLPDPNSDTFIVTLYEGSVRISIDQYEIPDCYITSYADSSSTPAWSAADGGHGSGTEGQALSMDLASFTVGNPSLTPADAEVDWGDGSGWESQAVSGSGGVCTVQGTHTYRHAGNYSIAVACGWPDTVYATASVGGAALALSPASSFQPSDNIPFQGLTLATFTDPNSLATADDFLAQITWEAGHTSTGVVAYDSSAHDFTISGNYTFQQPGSHQVAVKVWNLYTAVRSPPRLTFKSGIPWPSRRFRWRSTT